MAEVRKLFEQQIRFDAKANSFQYLCHKKVLKLELNCNKLLKSIKLADPKRL